MELSLRAGCAHSEAWKLVGVPATCKSRPLTSWFTAGWRETEGGKSERKRERESKKVCVERGGRERDTERKKEDVYADRERRSKDVCI